MLFSEWNLDDAIRYAQEESREEGRAEGRTEGRMEGMLDGVLISLKNLIDTMGLTVEQAMSALKIPEAERQEYVDLLNRQ